MKTVVQNSNASLMLASLIGKGEINYEPIIAWSVELIGEESSAVIPVTVTGLWPDEEWVIFDLSTDKWWIVDDFGYGTIELKDYFKKHGRLKDRFLTLAKDFDKKFSELNLKGKNER